RSTRRPALSRVNRLFSLMVWRAGGLKHILPRTSAGIDQRRVAQFFPGIEIYFAPFALDVRSECSAHIRPFIPAQSKPAQVFPDRAAKFGPAPIPVEVFNSKNTLPASLTGAFLRAPGRHRMAEVKITIGRWGG